MNARKGALVLLTLVILSTASWSKSESMDRVATVVTPAGVSVSLGQDVTVCTPEGGDYRDILSVTVTPESGQTIFLQAKTTTKRVDCEGRCENPTATDTNLLAGMRIACRAVKVQTTRNHRGTDDASDNNGMVQFASLLYHPQPGEIGRPVTCSLQALGGFGGKGCLKLLGNAADATYLRASTQTGGVAWGTNLDEHNAEDNQGKSVTFIGRGLAPKSNSYPSGERAPDLGPKEFVLKGRRFNAHRFATSLDVFSDVQLTCESSEDPCQVIADLLVQQMKSPRVREVCSKTQVTRSVSIDRNSHHQKLHLKILNVPFNSACIGRSFIIKTLVKLNSTCVRDCDHVVVEYGAHNDPTLSYMNGRSIAIVVQNFRVVASPQSAY